MVKSFVEYITKNIVDKPEQVIINQKNENDLIQIEIITAKEDVGKIIGKNGQTVKALRAILNASVLKMKKRVVVNVKEKQGSFIVKNENETDI